jgi:hypothetical protein
VACAGVVGEAVPVSDAVITVVFVGGLLALVWFGWLYEPHWSSKDGLRFSCRTRPIRTDADLQHQARQQAAAQISMATLFGVGNRSKSSPFAAWRDARAFVDVAGGTVQIMTRFGPLRRPLPPARVLARSDQPLRRRWVYVVDTSPTRELRVPVTSRAVARLDDLVERASGNRLPS